MGWHIVGVVMGKSIWIDTIWENIIIYNHRTQHISMDIRNVLIIIQLSGSTIWHLGIWRYQVLSHIVKISIFEILILWFPWKIQKRLVVSLVGLVDSGRFI